MPITRDQLKPGVKYRVNKKTGWYNTGDVVWSPGELRMENNSALMQCSGYNIPHWLDINDLDLLTPEPKQPKTLDNLEEGDVLRNSVYEITILFVLKPGLYVTSSTTYNSPDYAGGIRTSADLLSCGYSLESPSTELTDLKAKRKELLSEANKLTGKIKILKRGL